MTPNNPSRGTAHKLRSWVPFTAWPLRRPLTSNAELDDVDVIADAYEMARQQALPGIKCPCCALPLEAVEYAYCSRILIDRCAKCGGIWLDAGELEALEKFFKRETRPRERFWETLCEAQRIWRFRLPGDFIEW